MKWPLKNLSVNIPDINSPAYFAFRRKYYHHEGIDLYCPLHQEVVAIESGTIVKIDKFTGEHAHPPTSHWNNTWSILIQGSSGVIGYCELEPFVKEGEQVTEGQSLGRIIPVLKKDKGNGITMLHLEHYATGTAEHVTWLLNEPQPAQLLNPRPLLERCLNASLKP